MVPPKAWLKKYLLLLIWGGDGSKTEDIDLADMSPSLLND
jgi:hypothetical protein